MTRERIERMPDDDWRKTDPRFQEPQLSRHLDVDEIEAPNRRRAKLGLAGQGRSVRSLSRPS